MENDNHIIMDDEYFKRATKRAKLFGEFNSLKQITVLEVKEG